MQIEALQGANSLPNLMGALLQATMQQSIELAVQQTAASLSLRLGAVAIDGLGESLDVYA